MTDIDPEGYTNDGCGCGRLYTYAGITEPGQHRPECQAVPIMTTADDLPDPADCWACQTAGTRLCHDHTDAARADAAERAWEMETGR